ncbi:MAG: hypothetical protein HY366_01895 [Candidatus Aenigmarchaeota archaeon]|nr:hypothetical protein [Candidatus Aenigmarchaeota archaeon]
MVTMKNVCIVGLGNLGKPLLDEMKKGPYNAVGYDKDPKRTEIPAIPKDADAYFITVLTTDQVADVLNQLPDDRLVVIESTISPDLLKTDVYKRKKAVVFSHRWFETDPGHQFFNQARVMGCAPDVRNEAKAFYEPIYKHRGLDFNKMVHMTDETTAALCKSVENAVRYVEIALAEELRMACDRNGVSFEKLRAAINTKWNINVKEARDGVGGHCLPKDMDIVLGSFVDEHGLFAKAKDVDVRYRKHIKAPRGAVAQ